MPHDPIPSSFLVGAIFFGAGLVKGVLGMGLPTFAMGLLGLLMPVAHAASLLTLPSLATNLWQALAGDALRALLRRLGTFQVGIVVGVGGAAALPPLSDQLGRLLLGACLLAYGALGAAGWRPPAVSARAQALAGPAVGAATGLVTGLTGVFVLPAVPYLQALGLDRNQFAQALGLSFTTSTIALAGLLVARGDMHLAASVQSALALGPALAGMWVGQTIRKALSEAAFRRCFFLGLAGLGGWLLWR
ncbi:MAG: sulfite exporter TauE/SafE family protein [Ramlibacter sp.]